MTTDSPPNSGPSVWMTEPMPPSPPLDKDATCDVCIVGAGMAGMLIADRLAADRLDVIVLDRDGIGCGETGRTTAHFVSALDDRFTTLVRAHGDKGARLAAESHAAAIDYVDALVKRLKADCGWQRLDGYLVVNEHHHQDADQLIEEEVAACMKAHAKVERATSLPDPWPKEFGRALKFPNQGQAHPLKLLRAVAAASTSAGVRIRGGTHVTKVHGGADAAVETEHGPVVRAKHIVVATNTPIHTRVAMHTKQAGYQTYVIAAAVPAGALPPLLMWDGLWEGDESYHYVRLMTAKDRGAETDLLIVGGEDHKTGQGPRGDEPFRCLEAWTRRHFPMAGAIEFKWSGEVMEPADGMGYIGRDPAGHDRVFIVTGDSGNGMTHAAIAAMLIPDLIMQRDNPWSTLYDPGRKVGWTSLGEFTSENINTLKQYGDWLRRGDVPDESNLARGQGGIIVSGLTHLAVYKDDTGQCTRLSAVCPHLGGLVRWNDQEKTWDCPCHSSRFDRHGRVIHGPANSDLTRQG